MEVMDLFTYAVVVVVVVVAVSLGATVLMDIQDSQQGSATGTVANESRTMVLNSAVTFQYDAWTGAPTVLDENDTAVDASNYSYSATAGTLTLLEAGVNNTPFNVSYGFTYEVYPVDYNTTVGGLDSLATWGEWMPTIALVVVITVVLGVLLVYLARRFI